MNAPAPPDRISREETIFNAAVELRDPAKRATYLELACDSDLALRARLDKMLAADEDSFFEKPLHPPSLADEPTLAVHPAPDPEPAALGERIGRYKLLQKVGEGGCGVVYMAEQSEPVKRRVALKVIKLGMDTKSVIARFEAERQALALMDHPNIAKVLDGGATEAGRPYFVMELVRGTKITDYCDQNNLSTRDRLDLFVKVCQAIQHAHQKGIIHRDIKPSNILVTLHDGVPVPKVIDFGIAKATTDQRLTDKTLFTALEQFIGTPAYMSPEQAEMSGLDIDTRCDIYSLGVLLYELLTGKTPFDARELLASGLDEMRRTIREKEPVRPSTKLSQELLAATTRESRQVGKGEREKVGGTATGTSHLPTYPPAHFQPAQHRAPENLRRLIPLLRGDVDWIVMKCLEKDRARRYETANGLASDIQRHLNNEAVLARPPSAAYRFQKLVRRNKLAFTAATAIATVLVLGVIVSTWQAVRATRAEREQSRQREVALKAGASEAVQRKLAETQRNVAVEQRKLADMQLALQAWEDGDLQRANDLIEASRPAPGEAPGFEWRYLKKLCQDQSIETFGGTNHQYRSAIFFDHDSLLLNDEKKLTLHNLSSGKDQVLLEDQDGISKPTFCSGNTNLPATVTDDGRIKVWDLAARRVRVEFGGHRLNSIYDTITFSRDGRWLASTISDNSVEILDVEARNLKPARIVHRYDAFARDVIFTPDGRQLFSIGSETVIRAWDVATGAEAGDPLEGHTGGVFALAISTDGLWMASGSSDSKVIVWDVISHKLVTTLFGHLAMVTALAFSPDQRILASGGHDRTIRLWDLKTGQQLSLLRGHGAPVTCLGFSPDGKTLVSRSNDGRVKVWKAGNGLENNILTSGQSAVSEIALSPDGGSLASDIRFSFEVKLWDLATRSRTILSGHSNEVIAFVFSPDGRILATGSHDQTVRLWDVNTHKAVGALTNGFPVGSLAFSPDGRTLVAGGSRHYFRVGGQGGLQFWDVPSHHAIGTVPGDASDIVAVALSASGSLLATGHQDGSVSLWDAQTRRLLQRFEGESGNAVNTLAFSPTEPLLASGDWGGNIVFYNTTTMERLNTLKANTMRVSSLAFSPDGRTLASVGEGGGLKLWHVATRQLALALKGHVGAVKGIAFSRDGNLMASCGNDSTVRLWPAATLKEASAATK